MQPASRLALWAGRAWPKMHANHPEVADDKKLAAAGYAMHSAAEASTAGPSLQRATQPSRVLPHEATLHLLAAAAHPDSHLPGLPHPHLQVPVRKACTGLLVWKDRCESLPGVLPS